ncbi:MAG: nuclear transport factor 2 family protein [Acetobacteraceae bacterium]
MTERTLADRAAIADLLHAYCRALDGMDLDAIPALFTEDCIVSYGPRLESRGSARLAADLARLWRWRRTSHHLSNVTIRVEGDRAEAESYVIAWHEAPDGGTATLFGQYRDRLVRTADGWRIAERRQFMNGNDAGFTVAIHPLPRRPPPEGWTPPDMSGR